MNYDRYKSEPVSDPRTDDVELHSFSLTARPHYRPHTTSMLSSHILRRFPNLRLRARLPTASFAAIPHRNFATAAPSPSANDLFANGTNTYYVEEMYRHWKLDKSSVHASWDAYFTGLDNGLSSAQAFTPVPTVIPPPSDGAPALHASSGAELDDHLKVSYSGAPRP